MSLFNKKSFVWGFFEPQVNDETKAKCKLCDCILSGGGTGKKAATTSLMNHIKNKHPKFYRVINHESNSDASLLESKTVSQGIKRKQVTLEGILDKKNKKKINGT